MTPHSLLIIHKLPTPYNDMFFNALAQSAEIDLEVYHLWKGSWRRPWKTELAQSYPNKYMKLLFGIDWSLCLKAWLEKETFFMVGDWGHLASISVILIRILRKFPVAIWADTPKENFPRPTIKRILRKRFLSFLLSRVDIVFGTGKPAVRILEELGAKHESLVILPCFVDIDLPQKDIISKPLINDLRSLCNCSEDDIVFSMIGTLTTNIKGQDIGIHAFVECMKKTGQTIGLLIAGDGPDRSKIEKMICDYELKKNVKILGWLEPDQVDILYRASDVIIHPSRFDSYPLVILEAMSYGLPVIGSDVCGSVEDRVKSGENGYSFINEDVDGLANIMAEMVVNHQMRKEIGNNALVTASQYPVELGVNIIKKSICKVLKK